MDEINFNEYLLFRVGDLHWAIPVCSVQEIQNLLSITEVHGAPKDIRGVINLRGSIVTVFDLLYSFLGESSDQNTEYRSIIVPWRDEIVGLMISEVEDILEFDERFFQTTPSNIDGAYSAYISSVYDNREGVTALIFDLEKFLQTRG